MPTRGRLGHLIAALAAVSCTSGAGPAPNPSATRTSTSAATTRTTTTGPTSTSTSSRPTTTVEGSVLPTPGDPGTWTIGAWQPAGRPVGGSPAVETNTLRHNPGGAAVAVARMDTPRLRFVFYAQGAVPAGLWPSVVATFNSGFKANQARGGWFVNGAAGVPLRDAAASLVIFADGSATVGQWGRDVQMTGRVAAVRQNLDLMVDGGRPANGLTGPSASLQAAWGYTLGGGIATWRSAVAVDAVGRMFYLAGPSLDPETLAWALVAAGATRAMELDINPAWPSFTSFTDEAGGPVGTKLLPTMSGSADHFLRGSGGRDFFAVLARS